MKFKLLLLLALAVFAFQNCAEKELSEIVIPAGSVNALAQAVAAVDEGGTVRLAAGIHTEDTTVVITRQICLVGEPGSVLKVKTNVFQEAINPSIHVMDVPNVCIQGINLQPLDVFGHTGVIFENSPNSSVENCTFSGHILPIVIHKCDNLSLNRNIISGTLTQLRGGHGIVWINGKNASVVNNKISNCYFGLWPCDEDGTFEGNEIFESAYGVVPCKVVRANKFVTPRGETIDASITCTNWTISNNEFHHNQWGIGLADESNNCTLSGNNFHDNGNAFFIVDSLRQGYDIELIGEYPEGNNRFGVAILPCHHNTITANPTDRIKDCGGVGNIIAGAMPITTDSCY